MKLIFFNRIEAHLNYQLYKDEHLHPKNLKREKIMEFDFVRFRGTLARIKYTTNSTRHKIIERNTFHWIISRSISDWLLLTIEFFFHPWAFKKLPSKKNFNVHSLFLFCFNRKLFRQCKATGKKNARLYSYLNNGSMFF